MMFETVVLFIIKSFLKGYLICESSLFRTRKAGLGSAFLYA
jgi:hypothetical protein